MPGDGVEPPYVETQPREWVTLDVSVNSQDSLSSDVGGQAAIPVTITNNGNIAAVGIVTVVEGGDCWWGRRSTITVIPKAFV